MGWTDPSDSEFFQIKSHVGSLCLIAVNEYLPSMTTAMGTSPAVRAEVAVIDGPGAGARYPDALFFGKKIVPQLKSSVGATVLGRIVHGQAKAGQSAPYQLDKAAPGDAEKANSYVAAYGDVESKPADTSHAGPDGYAPDQEQWRVQQSQQAQRQAPQPQVQAQPAPQLPPPPTYPATFTQPATVGGPQGDEPPF